MAEVISGMTGALQGSVTGMISRGQNLLDRFFPPEKRNELWAKISKFATEKPMLASFILSQIALTGFPLGLFIIMTITVIVFSILGALLVALLGALIFIVVAVGFGLLILLPTLFITTFAAAFIWLWGVGGYYILKWFNKKEIPGIHTEAKGGLKNLDGLTGEGGSTGDTGREEKANGAPKENGAPKNEGAGDKKKHGKDDKILNGTVKKTPVGDKLGDVGKTTGVDLDNPNPKKAADVGKVAGKTGDLKKAIDPPGGIL